MKKILIVLTGGTIGSRIMGSTIDVTDTSSYHLISLYREKYGEDECFEVWQPISVLSENMRPDIWTELIKTLWKIEWQNYSGVIITHGSDTLAYTSALIGMMFCHVPVPVVLTASNYPLGEEKSNGLENFRSSVELIRTSHLKGVFTVYQNGKKENCVYLASRITEADPYLDEFSAFGGSVYGKIKDGKLQTEEVKVNPKQTELCEFCEKREAIAGKVPVFEKEILLIRPYPGMNYEWIDLKKKPAAVLHYLYHSATACTEGESHSLSVFLKRCRKANVPVYTASYKNENGPSYITAKEIVKEGAIPMMNISLEAAYMKLLLLYNVCSEEEVKDRVQKKENLYYEHLECFS